MRSGYRLLKKRLTNKLRKSHRDDRKNVAPDNYRYYFGTTFL